MRNFQKLLKFINRKPRPNYCGTEYGTNCRGVCSRFVSWENRCPGNTGALAHVWEKSNTTGALNLLACCLTWRVGLCCRLLMSFWEGDALPDSFRLAVNVTMALLSDKQSIQMCLILAIGAKSVLFWGWRNILVLQETLSASVIMWIMVISAPVCFAWNVWMKW